MKLIIGLGNPENEYAGTRHNVGFAVLDAVHAALPDMPAFREEKKWQSLVIDLKTTQDHLLFLKPTTFMNTSGDAVRLAMEYFHVPADDIWVVHDELDLPLGTVRISYDSRSAGHNGVQSIIDLLGTKAFHRLRIGIKTDEAAVIPAERFVLMPFSPAEQEILRAHAYPVVREWLESTLRLHTTQPLQ